MKNCNIICLQLFKILFCIRVKPSSLGMHSWDLRRDQGHLESWFICWWPLKDYSVKTFPFPSNFSESSSQLAQPGTRVTLLSFAVSQTCTIPDCQTQHVGWFFFLINSRYVCEREIGTRSPQSELGIWSRSQFLCSRKPIFPIDAREAAPFVGTASVSISSFRGAGFFSFDH